MPRPDRFPPTQRPAVHQDAKQQGRQFERRHGRRKALVVVDGAHQRPYLLRLGDGSEIALHRRR